MANYGDALAALDAFRAQLHEETANEIEDLSGPQPAIAFAAAGAVGTTPPGLWGPLTNVHATGVGLRSRGGHLVQNDFVLKVYVFDKLALGGATPPITSKPFQHVGVDVEALPIQKAFVAAAPLPVPPIPNQSRHRPIVGGVSISPLNAQFVGTLGCFVRRGRAGVEQIFALSNNHVLVDVNQLPVGTAIVQPGPETGPTQPGDTFAALASFIPIAFQQPGQPRPTNFFDAAIARVTDDQLIRRRDILGIRNYSARLSAPAPGMAVTKSGRTTGVTGGTIIATHVNGVQVDYGQPGSPLIAVYNDTVQIRSPQGAFSRPGDSGSVIVDNSTGDGVALLFAGNGLTTTACNLAGACRRFGVTLA